MTVSVKPKLAQLKTPMTSTFPSELSALSARTPLSAFPDYIKQEDGISTPIIPPTAYTDFLKSMASPACGDKSPGRYTPTSVPSSATSERLFDHKLPSSASYPISAPASARSTRPRILPSPVFSACDTPLSATSSARSPFLARSPYDWDPSSSKGRYFDIKSPKTSRPSIRHHVREIVTRTVTYTPRMSPAPKGKRRKLD